MTSQEDFLMLTARNFLILTSYEHEHTKLSCCAQETCGAYISIAKIVATRNATSAFTLIRASFGPDALFLMNGSPRIANQCEAVAMTPRIETPAASVFKKKFICHLTGCSGTLRGGSQRVTNKLSQTLFNTDDCEKLYCPLNPIFGKLAAASQVARNKVGQSCED